MDEIEYKLNTNNSVLVVNAVDKLISLIKSQYKPAERQRFALENEQLKILRGKCQAKEQVVSLTACQGLLALVELGVLEIGHTMSTIVTLLPSAHNYSAIISTMAGLLILDLKSRLVPGQPYRCQFSLKSPQHPFITVLEKNKDAEDDVLAQMQALCTHPDYVVSSNSLELLRPVFLWLTCNPRHSCGARPWQLLLSLPASQPQLNLLLSCLSCQQICNPDLIERAFAAYSAVADTAIHRRDAAHVRALLPMLARISNEMLKHGRDPRAVYALLERCAALEADAAAGLTLALLADNLPRTPALHLPALLHACLNIVTKFKCTSIALNTFVALSLQWLHMPSHLTTNALKVASKLLDIYETETPEQRLDMPNLRTNKIFEALVSTDCRLSVMFKLYETWERVRDDPERLKGWLRVMEAADGAMKLELVAFLIGVAMERRTEEWFEEIKLRCLRMVVGAVELKKELSVLLLPVLLYKLARDPAPAVRLECLRALPLMAKTKENVHNIVSILNKLKAGKGVPTSQLIAMYTSLAETQVRCFPYLQELLAEAAPARADDLRWELDLAKAVAVHRVCEIRPSTHGLELVSTISSTLNRCSDRAGAAGACVALQALARLWLAAALAPPSTWRALEPKLARDARPKVQASICKLLAEAPALRVQTAEYEQLLSDAARRLWAYVADSNHPAVAIEACKALANYKIDDYKLKDVPQVYRNAVKLPPSFCKTPADAARRPEDVLDYVPCEVWPEVFKCTNQDALSGVEYLCSRLVERELRAYRSGVYQHERAPASLAYLPAASVLRGVMDCFKRQVTSPSYEFPDAVLLSMLRVLSAEYGRALPPVELWFLQELLPRGAQWPRGALALAARQAASSPHARSLLDNYLMGIDPDKSQESDILLFFSLLPQLCRGMPPNSLREPLERCLGAALDACLRLRPEDPLLARELDLVRVCLENERIHEANRTLLSQMVEGYFSLLPDDNVVWATYVRTCTALSSKYLERMTSPSGWWEVTSGSLRKARAVRAAAAAHADCTHPLAWLNEIIDAHATHLPEQQQSLKCILQVLQVAKPDDQSTRDWFLQLMARTQVAFKETEDTSAHLYLFDVFALSAVVLSGLGALQPSPAELLARRALLALLPAAAAALLARPAWRDATLQMLEWLSHTRALLGSAEAAAACQRALLALRHTPQFATHKIWTRLESHFGIMTNTDDEN